MNTRLMTKMAAIREGIERGEEWDTIAARVGTTVTAVRVVGRGMGRARPTPVAVAETAGGPVPRAVDAASDQATVQPVDSAASQPSVPTAVCPAVGGALPWTGRYVAIDGTNVAGWGQRKGEPRLAQVLAVCRYFSGTGVRFACWFDSNFRWVVKRFSERDAAVLERILKEEPGVFKQSPAGSGAGGEAIKADPFVLRDAAGEPDGMVLSDDLFRREAEADPAAFGWAQREPERLIKGAVAGNGDVLLGANGEVRIPVADDPSEYI